MYNVVKLFVDKLLCPGRGAEHCDQLVCLSVCLSVRNHIPGSAGPIFTKFCVQIPCGRGSILWRRCRCMDDVMFGHSELYSDVLGAESDVYECLVEFEFDFVTKSRYLL